MQQLNANILDVTEGVILHGCNCSNAFGSGLAGAIAAKYPEVKKIYHSAFNSSYEPQLLGCIQICNMDDVIIINGFTQLRYGRNGRYADVNAIESVLRTSSHLFDEIHIPRIGCGLGGLDWEKDVKPIVLSIESEHNVEFYVH